MKKFISSLLILTAAFGMTGCEDFLQVNPKQVLDENLLVKPSDMEGFVTAAYARMTDITSWDSPFSPWWSGSLRSDDSYNCLLYTSPSPRDRQISRMPSSA